MNDDHNDDSATPENSWSTFCQWAISGRWSYHVFDLWVACACAILLVAADQLGLLPGGPQLWWGTAVFAIILTVLTTGVAYFMFSRRK